MRKPVSRSRQWQVRRLIDECELRLEVSELEKILSQLAYLMGLCISECDELRHKLAQALGVTASEYRALSRAQVDSIKEIANFFCLPEKPRLVFWMWRSWLLQKEFDALKPGDFDVKPSDWPGGLCSAPDVRDEGEWESLDQSLRQLRHEVEAQLSEAGVLIRHLADACDEARYALGNTHGSPQGKLLAAKTLLLVGVKQLDGLSAKISNAYGFGRKHRPNKRFARNTVRDIRAYHDWKHRKREAEFGADFAQRADGRKGSPQEARTAAAKAASRFEANLYGFERTLEAIEGRGDMPAVSYARRVDDALDAGARTRNDG